MIPMLFAPGHQPAQAQPAPQEVPLRVNVAMHIYGMIAQRAAVAVASSRPGEKQKDPEFSPAEAKARDAALLTITRYMTGEHDFIEKLPPVRRSRRVSDFAKAGICEFDELPPLIQNQLRAEFPAGRRRPASQNQEPPRPTVAEVNAFIEAHRPPPDAPGAQVPAPQ